MNVALRQLIGLLCLASLSIGGNMRLPAFPLAVKNPYLSAWLPGNQSNHVPSAQPMFWAGQRLNWEVLARVDDQTYSLFGVPNSIPGVKAAQQLSISFTSTHTTVALQAGPAKLSLDFFSPISLIDFTRQSLPYSYLTVSQEGSSSKVTVFTAIDDSWTAQEGHANARFQKYGDDVILDITGVNSIAFSEKKQMATWGHTVLAAKSNNGATTYQIGSPADVHSSFVKNGKLSNVTPDYRTGFLTALSQPIGTDPAVFAIGLQQDRTIQFLNGEALSGYYAATVQNLTDITSHVIADYAAALQESKQLDTKVRNIGTAVSSNYADLLEAHMRQIFGGFQVTIPTKTLDTTKAMAFMKEISTDGNVNTLADLLPRALPAFYVLAPEYIRLFLEPILIFSKQWPADFAAHDLGKHYPNATGETVAAEEPLLLDQTSVLLWMTYAYQRISKNTTWIQPYIPTLQKYANYLVKNGLYPPKQRSAVDSISATANQTVLAMYSAIGLAAFGTMTNQANYTTKGREYASKLVQLGTNPAGNHIMAHYNDPGTSWISTYPFAFDRLLGLGLFDQKTIDMQNAWYETQQHPNGVQFYGGVQKTVSTLEMWLAATAGQKLRDYFIDSIHGTLGNGRSSVPGPTIWDVTGDNAGVAYMTRAKSDVGSYFMVAALQ